MDDRLNELKNEQASYNNEIDQCYGRIAELKEEYRTLQAFKRNVIRSQEDYGGGNSKKSAALNRAESVSRNCKVARIYCVGMGTVLNGLGAKLVNIIFERLKEKINNQLSAYQSDIIHYEDRISEYSAKLENTRQEYEAVKREQERKAKG